MTRIAVASLFLLLAGMQFCITEIAHAQTGQTARDLVVLCDAKAQFVPPAMTLYWTPQASASGYSIYRRTSANEEWGKPIATLDGAAASYTDATVARGVLYEYKIERKPGGSGFLFSGIDVPLRDQRGTIVLLVAQEDARALPEALAQFQQDLVGDGWSVIRHDVPLTWNPPQVRALVQADYAADPQGVKAVLILGHIAVPKSGWMAPDGHHSRPMPADGYYGDMDGVWTDEKTLDANGNTPGDGKFDQFTFPSEIELAVGRADFVNLGSFEKTYPDSEYVSKDQRALLKQYLEKDHRFRYKLYVPEYRALIDDSFGSYAGFPAQGGWRFLTPLVGRNNIFEKDWHTELPKNSYLFAYGDGPGSYSTCGGVTTTAQMPVDDPKAVFTMIFGSYFVEWDHGDDLMRGALATTTAGLTCMWATWPERTMHPMGMGGTIGDALLTNQNDNKHAYGGYTPVHVTLLGDPTLHMHVASPPGAVTAAKESTGSVLVRWEPSADSEVVGYHVYRAVVPEGPFERLTDSPVDDIAFRDTAPRPGRNVYLVRAIVRQASATGSYFLASQGVFAEVSMPLTRPLPDISIAAANGPFHGAYEFAPVPQTLQQTILAGGKATYRVHTANDGQPVAIKLIASLPTPGWQIRYFSGDKELTPVAIKDGTAVTEFVPGTAADLRIELTPTANAARDCRLTLTASAAAGKTRVSDQVTAITKVEPIIQPDLQIRTAEETAFTGVGLYDDGTAQARQLSIKPRSKATYNIQLCNNGPQPTDFQLIMNREQNVPSIFYRVFDALTDGTDVTAQLNDGLIIRSLAPGKTQLFRIEVTSYNAPQAEIELPLQLTATALGLARKTDSIRMSTKLLPLGPYQPDLTVFGQGDNIYLDDTQQTIVRPLNRKLKSMKVAVPISVQHDGTAADDKVLVKGDGGGDGWTVAYFDTLQGGNDITAAITGAGYMVEGVSAKTPKMLRVEVTADENVPMDAARKLTLTATSQGDAAKTDRIIIALTSTVPVQPDLLLRNQGEEAFAGEGMFGFGGANGNPLKTQKVAVNATAVYHLKLRNVSDKIADFSLNQTPAPAEWRVRYFDALAGGTDITAKVQDRMGWTIPNLAPNQEIPLRVEVTLLAPQPADKSFSLNLYARSITGAMIGNDAVQLVTVPDAATAPAGGRSVLQISKAEGSDGMQTFDQPVKSAAVQAIAGAAARLRLRVVNEGTAADTLTLTGAPVPAGWMVQFLDSDGADHTAEMVGKGWTPAAMAPKAVKEFECIITPTATGRATSSCEISVKVASAANAGTPDTVKVNVQARQGGVPDLLLRPAGKPAFMGDNLYLLDGRQSITQSLAGGVAVYQLQVQNDGDTPQAMTVTGPAGTKGWTVRYFAGYLGDRDVTEQVTGAGWTTRTLAPGDVKIFRVEVRADAAVKIGALYPIVVTAAAGERKDAVKLVTKR